MAGIKDFATGIVVTAPSPATSGVTLALQTGEGARMPAVPFFATAHPATEMPTLDNAEKVSVTDVTGDVLTIVRAQGNTTAKSIAAGWRVSNALFADDIAIALADLTDDATHRLVTDTEKSTWNAKQAAMGADDNYVTDAEKAALHGQNDSNSSSEPAGTVATHAALTTGVHGVGAGTIAKTSDIPSAGSTPSTQAFGDTAAGGSATTWSKNDHKHAMPAAPTTITGNAGTATALATPRAINGVNFDGSAAITIPDVIVTAAPGSDHTATGMKIALTAASNIAFGDVCYIASTGKATLIDADAIASMSAIAMCIDATINADASGNFLLMGIARDDTWAWTVGGVIYGTVTGTTANTLSQTAPTGADDVVQIMGVATHADRMFFNPQLVQIERS